MKTYDQLTPEQQQEAREHCLQELLQLTCEGALTFTDQLQDKIEAAAQRAEEMHTPWFVGSYIMDTCKEEFEAMAKLDAERSFYRGIDDPPSIYLSSL